MRHFFAGLLKIYKRIISPLLPAACLYHPTCSSYMAMAILRLGVVKGMVLGLARLGRCNSHFCGGNDEPPRRLPWKLVWPYVRRTWKRFVC